MKRSTERILTTHVGSLVRPPAILEGMKAQPSVQWAKLEALVDGAALASAQLWRVPVAAGASTA